MPRRAQIAAQQPLSAGPIERTLSYTPCDGRTAEARTVGQTMSSLDAESLALQWGECQSEHPCRARMVEERDNLVIVRVFFEVPKLRPSPYRILAIDAPRGSVSELVGEAAEPYVTRPYK